MSSLFIDILKRDRNAATTQVPSIAAGKVKEAITSKSDSKAYIKFASNNTVINRRVSANKQPWHQRSLSQRKHTQQGRLLPKNTFSKFCCNLQTDCCIATRNNVYLCFRWRFYSTPASPRYQQGNAQHNDTTKSLLLGTTCLSHHAYHLTAS